MKCRICRNATLPGARLCGPCRAALNRARHGAEGTTAAVDDATVAGEVHAPPAPAGSRPGSDAAAAPKPRRWPAVVMGASVVGAALAYAWLGSGIQPRLTATSAAVPAVARSQPPPPVAAPSPSEAVQPADTAGAAVSAEPAAQPTAREPSTHEPMAARHDAVRHDAVPRRLAAGREPATVRRHPPAVSDTDHAGGDVRAAMVDPVVANPPASVQAFAARSPPGDRWQALNEALEACGGNFIERIVCGQRARFRYCDGYWGRVPQCPSGAVADNR
jgi:hypothetical protein